MCLKTHPPPPAEAHTYAHHSWNGAQVAGQKGPVYWEVLKAPPWSAGALRGNYVSLPFDCLDHSGPPCKEGRGEEGRGTGAI